MVAMNPPAANAAAAGQAQNNPQGDEADSRPPLARRAADGAVLVLGV
jgi:hypothetical protein